MRRTVFNEDHEAFRETIRAFIEAEVVPVYDEWFAAGQAPARLLLQARRAGRLRHRACPRSTAARAWTRYKFEAVIYEETARAGVSFGGSGVHVAARACRTSRCYATDEQKKRWLPKFVSGEEMWAIAMTEPGTGSDLAGMKTTAKLSEDGTHYVLNGAKTFITGGVHADRVIVCARTAPPTAEDRRFGISLFVVDTKSEGYSVGRKLDKLGLKTSDTAELSFVDVKVPGRGPARRGEQGLLLPRPQPASGALGIAFGAYAQAKAAVRFAKQYVQERTVFGKTGRLLPEHQVRAGRLQGRGGRRRGRRRPRPGGAGRRRADRRRGRLRQAVLHRGRRTASSTAASSCTAATAT